MHQKKLPKERLRSKFSININEIEYSLLARLAENSSNSMSSYVRKLVWEDAVRIGLVEPQSDE